MTGSPAGGRSPRAWCPDLLGTIERHRSSPYRAADLRVPDRLPGDR